MFESHLMNEEIEVIWLLSYDAGHPHHLSCVWRDALAVITTDNVGQVTRRYRTEG